MGATRKELAAAVKKLMDKTKDPKALAQSVAAYLLEARQSREVDALLRDLEALRLSQDKTLEVYVTTARPLSEATKNDIKSLFDAKNIIVHETQDPSIIGGVKVRAHDQQLDESVRTRLQRLKRDHNRS